MVSCEASWAHGSRESATLRSGGASGVPAEIAGRKMVARGNQRVSSACEAHARGMGLGVFAGSRQHESGDDGEIHARGKAGTSESGLARALSRRQRDASRTV